MTLVSVVEHEVIPVVARLDHPAHKALTFAEAERLIGVGAARRIRVAEYVARDRIKVRQFVGLVSLGARSIEVLPKIESPAGDASTTVVRHNLLHMLLAAFDINIHIPGAVDAEVGRADWLDAFIQAFCAQLAEQVRFGLIKQYRVEEDDLAQLRGNLLVEEQLRRNFIHQERIACEFDELDEDHLLNQVFKASLTRMLPFARSVAGQRAVRQLVVSFDGVSSRSSASRWWRHVSLNRLSARFQPALQMAQLFLDGLGPDVKHGGNGSFALLFDMNDLFESYVGKEMRRCTRASALQVQLQHSKHQLIWDPVGKASLFALRPDIVAFSDGHAVCIADTKWKRLEVAERKMGVNQGDLYQMLAYADRYACDSILLIYPYQPMGPEGGSVRRLLHFMGRKTVVLVATVHLENLKSVGDQLSSMLAYVREQADIRQGELSTCLLQPSTRLQL
jgi:5-methylcytosine-specific restriction enzyme subunit McrC